MFLNRLDRPRQEAFINLARELVAADGVGSLGELAHLGTLRRELGIGSGEATEVLSVDAAAARFVDRESRTIVLIELLHLAHADRSFTPRESSLIKRLCTIWNVGDERLAEIEGWTRRYRELMREANAMLSGT